MSVWCLEIKNFIIIFIFIFILNNIMYLLFVIKIYFRTYKKSYWNY